MAEQSVCSEPLIYTSKGNLPVASLEYRAEWDDQPDYVKLTETYTLAGEVVKQSAHVMGKRGFMSESLAGSLS